MPPTNFPDRFKQYRSTLIELFLTALAAALVWIGKWFLFGLEPVVGDGPTYLAMARGEAAPAPWSFHILTPKLAGFFFPADPAMGFFCISALCFAGTSVTINLLLRRVLFDTSISERAFGFGLFAATGTGVFMFRGYFWTDSLSYFLLAVSCTAILYRRDEILGLCALIGIFNRETAFFVIPFWFLANYGKYPPFQLFRRFFWIFLPAGAVYYLLHFTSFFFGTDPPLFNFLQPETIQDLWRINLIWLGTDNVFYGLSICVFLAYGVVWFLALCGGYYSFANWKWDHPANLLWSLMIPVAASLLVVDWRRGFQPLFPAIIVSAVFAAGLLTSQLPRFFWYLLAITTILANILISEAWWFTPMRRPIFIGLGLWTSVILLIILVNYFNNFILSEKRSPKI